MRRKRYTPRGMSRVPCCRCGKPSRYQWQCCALDNIWMGLCVDCDIGLNRVTLEYIGLPETEALMERYERIARPVRDAVSKVLRNPANSKKSKTARGKALTMIED